LVQLGTPHYEHPSEAAEVGKLVDAYLKAIEVTEVLARLEKLEQRL